jgi:hypothetical protein
VGRGWSRLICALLQEVHPLPALQVHQQSAAVRKARTVLATVSSKFVLSGFQTWVDGCARDRGVFRSDSVRGV